LTWAVQKSDIHILSKGLDTPSLFLAMFCRPNSLRILFSIMCTLSQEGLCQGFSTHFHLWTTMPFQITLWIPVDNQKIIRRKNQFTHCIKLMQMAEVVWLHKSCGPLQ